MLGNNFGINIGEQTCQMGFVTETKGKFEILSYGYESVIPTFFTNPSDQMAQDQAKILISLYEKLNLSSKKVNVVLPDVFSYSQLLIMPDLSEEQLVNSIKLQADEFIPLPLSEVYIDIEIISKLPNNKILLLFVASRKTIVDHIHKTIEYAGLDPDTLENELTAVGRFVSEFFKFIHEPSLILNFGHSGSSIYVVNPNFPFFQITRNSRIGFDIIFRDLKLNTNLGDKTGEVLKNIGLNTQGSFNVSAVIYPVISELISELEKTLTLAKEKYHLNIKHIYLMNNDYKIGWFSETIQNKLMVPAQTIPLSTVLVPNQITQAFSQLLGTLLPVIATQVR